MANKDVGRRLVLRLMRASSAFWVTGFPRADDSENIGLDKKHVFFHNLSVTNFTKQNQQVTLSIVNPDVEAMIHQQTVRLQPAEGNEKSFLTLSLPGSVDGDGRHKLVAENAMSRDMASIYLNGGNLPSFIKGTAMVKPNGKVKVTSSIA